MGLEVRPRATIQVRRLPVVEEAPRDYWRPSTRADCKDGVRPCPFVSCRHHLFLDVKPNGNIRLNFPHLEPSQLLDSCSLDVSDEGSHSLMRVGDALGVTREMVRQMEAKILRSLPIDRAGRGLEEQPEPRPGPPLGRDGVREIDP